MGDIVTRLFDTDGFPPRRECGTGWTPELVWLHIGSDLFIWLAYLSIPLVLLYFVRRRQDLPFSRLFVLFALFILACGFTHAIDALIFYSPVYRLGGVVKLVTAVVSWATVIALVPVVPRALELMAVLAKAKTETAVHRPIREAQETRPRNYIVAILAGVLAVLVRGALDPFLQTDHLFVVSLLAVVFVSWRSGFGPGLATLLVSMAGITYFFVSPRNSWVVEGSGNQLALAMFFFCGVCCAALGEAQRFARRRAQAALAEALAQRGGLEEEVARRKGVEFALRQREADLLDLNAQFARSERAAAEALAQLDTFLMNAPVGIAYYDPELRYVRVNSYLAAANRRPVEEHVGRTTREVVPDFPDDLLADMRRALDPSAVPVARTLATPAGPGGPPVTWQVIVFPVRSPADEPLGVGVIAQDATARVKAERELRASEERFRTFVDNSPGPLFIKDPGGRYLLANKGVQAVTGRPASEVVGRTDEALFDPATARRLREQDRRVLATGRPMVFEDEFESAGRRLTLLRTKFPLPDGSVGGIATDITDRKRAEEDAREANRRVLSILDSITDAAFGLDRRFRYTYANRHWEAMFGRAAGDVVGRSIWEVMPGLVGTAVEAGYKRAMLDRRPVTVELVHPATGRWVEFRAYPAPDGGLGVYLHDIEDRKRTEDALRESEARYKAVVETAVDGIITIDERGAVASLNPAAERMFGYRAAELTGRNVNVLMPDPYHAEHDGYLARYLRTGERRVIGIGREVAGRRGDGSTFPLELSVSETVVGGRRMFTGIVRDVTDRKRAEDALRESEERFRGLADGVAALVWVSDLDGRRTYFNRTWLEFVGRTLEEEAGAGWAENIHPDDRDRYLGAYAAAFAAREPFELEYRLRRHDGAYRWVLARGTPRFAPSGAFAGFVGLCLDITDRREAAEAVRRSEERFRTLAEAIPQIVWNADADGRVSYFNTRWLEYTGLSVEDARGRGWVDAVHPEEADRVDAAWRMAVLRAAEGADARFSHELRLRQAGGGYRWMLAVAVVLRRPDGTVDQWIGSMADIDDQKRHAERLEQLVRERTAELVKANEVLRDEVEERRRAEELVQATARELERSNAELEKFAYVASHDLQEPLRKIQAFGDRLRGKFRSQLPEGGRDYVDRMLTSAGRMRRLIDDLLTFSRVTTQGRPFERIDLDAVLRDVKSDLEVRIEQTRGTVDVGPLPAIDADFSQMRQLFQNLLGNALKFHRPGVPPVVRVRGELLPPLPSGERGGGEGAPSPSPGSPREPPSPPRGEGQAGDPVPLTCRVIVQDNGIGFDEKYRERIFEVFQRLHGRDEYDGTGVGLAICHKIVERHGGTITAHSRPGEGATFVVTLPVRQPREDADRDGQADQADHHPDGR